MINKFWSKAVVSWVPISQYTEICKWISNFFLQKALETDEHKIKDYCISKLLAYSSNHPQNIRLIASWILDFDFEIAIPINLDENEEEEVYPAESLYPIGLTMTIHHKYYSIKYICESTHLDKIVKDEIMKRVFGQD